MPDHSWMRDVLIDIAAYAEKHDMTEVYKSIAKAIEAVLLLGLAAPEQSKAMNEVVVELSSLRPFSAEGASAEHERVNRSG